MYPFCTRSEEEKNTILSVAKGAFRLLIKSAGMEKFPRRLGHAMLSGCFRRERFTAGARQGGKGDKSIIPRARSRRWAVFIAIFICHGEEANGIFLQCLSVRKNTGVNGFHTLSRFTV